MGSGPQIDPVGESFAQRYRKTKKGESRHLNWVVTGLLLGVFLAGYGILRLGDSTPEDAQTTDTQEGNSAVSTQPRALDSGVNPKAIQGSDPRGAMQNKKAFGMGAGTSDIKPVWVSPTQGEPWELSYLPAGSHLLIHVRPQAIGSHPEREKIVAALGNWGADRLLDIQRWYPGEWEELPAIMLAIGSSSLGQLDFALRIELDVSWTNSLLYQRLVKSKQGPCEKMSHQNNIYYLVAGRAYWLPPGADGKILVICEPREMPELMDNSPIPIALPRDVQRLVSSTDQQRMFTALFLMKFLQGSGQRLLEDRLNPPGQLPRVLSWLWGQNATASILSLHWDDDFFIEMQAVATINVRQYRFAREISERIASLSTRSISYLEELDVASHARPVTDQLPRMFHELSRHTRSGAEGGRVLVRCYLPLRAGHNLLLAGALCLSASMSDQREEGSPSISTFLRPGPLHPEDVESKLAAKTTLILPKESLEQALQVFSEDLTLTIRLLGKDLQLAGITKNQSLNLSMRKQTGREILLEILRQANPDQSATGPGDPRQSLIYVVHGEPDKNQEIWVTTRAAAKLRGDVLPKEFQPDSL